MIDIQSRICPIIMDTKSIYELVPLVYHMVLSIRVGEKMHDMQLPPLSSKTTSPKPKNKYLVCFLISFAALCCNTAYMMVSVHRQYSAYHEVEMYVDLISQSFGIQYKDTNTTDTSDINTWFIEEEEALRNVLIRARRSEKSCQNQNATSPADVSIREPFGDVPFLPEFGIGPSIERFLKKHDSNEKDQISEWGQCKLPPTTSCHVHNVSVVLMAHNTHGLDSIKNNTWKQGRLGHFPKRLIDEIILVWNGPDRASFEESVEGKMLMEWRDERDFPLRLFVSIEHGLGNNLLNRYHPLIAPKNEAVLFFDDDGPFYKYFAIDTGFELWKRNSGRQVGSMGRQFEISTSDRRFALQMESMNTAIDEVLNERESARYDIDAIDQQPFLPHCRTHAGDQVQYNFHTFSPFHAHMVLPSGSFLHRNLLCFIWHPAFEALREYVGRHPTHPDDIAVSSLVSQVTGRSPRTYSQHTPKRNSMDVLEDGQVQNRGHLPDIFAIPLLPKYEDGDSVRRRRLLSSAATNASKPILALNEDDETLMGQKEDDSEQYDHYMLQRSASLNILTSDNDNDTTKSDTSHYGQSRRRLMWKDNKDWGNLRDDAINSIVGYFGSFNGGSVGWCLSTRFHQKSEIHWCDHSSASLDWLPWINDGGVGHSICPLPPYAQVHTDQTKLCFKGSRKRFASILKQQVF